MDHHHELPYHNKETYTQTSQSQLDHHDDLHHRNKEIYVPKQTDNKYQDMININRETNIEDQKTQAT